MDEITEPILCAPNDPDDARLLSEVTGEKIDEVFIGSCMTNIGAPTHTIHTLCTPSMHTLHTTTILYDYNTTAILTEVTGETIDEIFIGSCMTNIDIHMYV